MNQYRRVLMFYLAIWLVLALAPAVCAVLPDPGLLQLRSVLAETMEAFFSGTEKSTPPAGTTTEPPLPLLEPVNPRRNASYRMPDPPLALRKLEGSW